MSNPLPHVPVTTARALLEEPSLASELESVVPTADLARTIDHARIQKSGLALAGHLVGVVSSRVQILGETEISFLESLAPAERVQNLRALFAMDLSLVIVTRGIEVPADLASVAEHTHTPVFVSKGRSSATIANVHAALDRLLAPRQSRHGVMVEVHGLGVLLIGPSGIGKSESALVLIERGHRLVADDRVDLVRMGDHVFGRAPRLLQHHIEIRGLGILNVRDLFGATAVCEQARLDVVVELGEMSNDMTIDRLGLDDLFLDVLGVRVPTLRIPVHPGRELGVLLEVAARNELLKRAGRHGAREFSEQLQRATGLSVR